MQCVALLPIYIRHQSLVQHAEIRASRFSRSSFVPPKKQQHNEPPRRRRPGPVHPLYLPSVLRHSRTSLAARRWLHGFARGSFYCAELKYLAAKTMGRLPHPDTARLALGGRVLYRPVVTFPQTTNRLVFLLIEPLPNQSPQPTTNNRSAPPPVHPVEPLVFRRHQYLAGPRRRRLLRPRRSWNPSGIYRTSHISGKVTKWSSYSSEIHPHQEGWGGRSRPLSLHR